MKPSSPSARLGDGQHRDHRPDAEDHAEHGQQAAQLVQEQVVDLRPRSGSQRTVVIARRVAPPAAALERARDGELE